ncbi:hypothetical protein PVK06_031156 [Gossypium arboreum]|uniref:Uncharacterized protein n=1 Tax=Gossypium arboreum TaxID=29729 RepID=A0ABR0NQU7_GOSAR|nr:hypothetical protein PVK06_031156 [Gossypium arboreum]
MLSTSTRYVQTKDLCSKGQSLVGVDRGASLGESLEGFIDIKEDNAFDVCAGNTTIPQYTHDMRNKSESGSLKKENMKKRKKSPHIELSES